MVCHCSLARQKNTTSALVCSWRLFLTCNNQQNILVTSRLNTQAVNSPHCEGLSMHQRRNQYLYLQSTLKESWTGNYCHGSRMHEQMEAGTGCDLMPPCLFLSTSSLLSCSSHPLSSFLPSFLWHAHDQIGLNLLSSSNLLCKNFSSLLWHPSLSDTDSLCLQPLNLLSEERTQRMKWEDLLCSPLLQVFKQHKGTFLSEWGEEQQNSSGISRINITSHTQRVWGPTHHSTQQTGAETAWSTVHKDQFSALLFKETTMPMSYSFGYHKWRGLSLVFAFKYVWWRYLQDKKQSQNITVRESAVKMEVLTDVSVDLIWDWIQ